MKLFIPTLLLTTMAFSAPSVASKGTPLALDTVVGRYSCAFTEVYQDETFTYPDFRCEIKQQGDAFTLEKTSGSQRFRGKITATDDGFSFNGIFFCPAGACTSDLTGEYKRTGKHHFEGRIYDPNAPEPFRIVDLKRIQ
ncbi:DUF4893 domain-containing protein [Photobacterium japonica]|uniref:DUF4893 domain-containing protein n=1 Tax=Photobacterium japonica TaxID=2910235 RepID=UPI003D10E0AF